MKRQFERIIFDLRNLLKSKSEITKEEYVILCRIIEILRNKIMYISMNQKYKDDLEREFRR